MKKYLLLLFASTVAVGHAIVIDDFSSGVLNESIDSGSLVLTQVGTMASGERDVEMMVVSNPQNQFFDLNINTNGSGLSIVSSGFNMVSSFSLQYDVVGDEVTGSGQSLNNPGSGIPVLSTTDSVIRINFLGNDLPLTVTGTLRSGNSVLENVVAVKAPGAGALDLVFSGSIGAADSITVNFVTSPSGDYAISSIETVPEPASMAIMALGLVGVAARRRKK
jgi:hypothetical protein